MPIPWLIVGAAAVAAALLGKAVSGGKSQSPSTKGSKAPRRAKKSPQRPLRVLGEFDPPLALLFGRTGAGKTSVVNALLGMQLLETNRVASTTRSIRGVPMTMGGVNMTLVDTPGIGEVLTSSQYRHGLVDWFQKNSKDVGLLVLVLQADSKAHSEDSKILKEFRKVSPSCPLLIVLNQVDKLPPSRGEELSETWLEESKRSQPKAVLIQKKIDIVAGQFQTPEDSIIPFCAEPDSLFNLSGLEEGLTQTMV
jgi:small GTP-binding protein